MVANKTIQAELEPSVMALDALDRLDIARAVVASAELGEDGDGTLEVAGHRVRWCLEEMKLTVRLASE